MSDASATLPSPRQRSERIAFRRGLTLLLMTLFVPGSAQIVAGGRGLGRFALRVWLGVLVAVIGFVTLLLVQRNWAIALYTHPATQWLASGVVLVLGLGWAYLLLDAWRLSHPRHMGSRKWGMAVLAGVLALGVGMGSAQASALSRSQAELFGTVFAGGGQSDPTDGRINILLLGADAEPDRPGIRTDTMMVASVSATTGRTVLFSLPRNLQWAPFPRNSPLRELYPRGYWCADQSCMLNAVHSEADKHPGLYPGVKDPGLTAVREVISETLGLKLNYYAMVDMRGFEHLVDALGGVTLDIAKAVPIGGGSAKVEGYIQPGKNVHLDGFQALWFARSRHGASDYERMARQKCVVNALAKQATPVNLVTRFTDLASAGSAMVATDIPGSELGRLVELANAGRKLPIASTSFAPPLIEPVKPDLGLIRATVVKDIAASVALDKEAAAAASTAAPAAPSGTPAPAGTPAASTRPTPTPSATRTAKQPGVSAAPSAPASSAPVVASSAPKATAGFSQERQTTDLTDICGVS